MTDVHPMAHEGIDVLNSAVCNQKPGVLAFGAGFVTEEGIHGVKPGKLAIGEINAVLIQETSLLWVVWDRDLEWRMK